MCWLLRAYAGKFVINKSGLQQCDKYIPFLCLCLIKLKPKPKALVTCLLMPVHLSGKIERDLTEQ